MYLKILKKDLRRKKSMNIILLIFILLATTFIAGSINNIIVLMNGTDYFIKRAGVSDYVIFTMNREGNVASNDSEEISEEVSNQISEEASEEISDRISDEISDENDLAIRDFLDEQDTVDRYCYDTMLFLAENRLKKEDGSTILLGGKTVLLNNIIKQQKFFDENDEEITEVEDGTIYMSLGIMDSNDLKVGDEIDIEYKEGVTKRFKIVGYIKDATLGSEMMGTKRWLISEADYREIYSDTDYTKGGLFSVWCNDLDKFDTAYNKCEFSTIFGDHINMIKNLYMLNMVVAGVILLISVFLVMISVVMLRFTIVFTINEDFKEIGIMKAIGLKDSSVRKLYVSKYFAISLAGAFVGCILSMPFSKLLLDQITKEMVIKNRNGNVVLAVGVSIAVVILVCLFAYLSTGKIKKFTPMDAIRNGNSGERFKKKGLFRLKNSRLRPTTFMAINDIFSELRKYIILLFASIIGVWLVIMPANTINTLNSAELIRWFGMSRSDYIIVDSDRLLDVISAGDRQNILNYLAETKEGLEAAGVHVERLKFEAFFSNIKISKGDKSYLSFALQGVGSTTDEYFYDKGKAPEYENEVAITHVVADKIDAGIGDTVYIVTGDEAKPYIVTAIYQSMNNMGEGIRFHQDEELDYSRLGGAFGINVMLEGDATRADIKEAIRKTKEVFKEAKVFTESEFVYDTIGGISEQIKGIKLLALTLVMIINVLVVVLMQKMFLIRERGEMGMLKSIGFKNLAIVVWQTKRIMLVLFAGILIGTVTGAAFTRVTMGQVFQVMGASRMEFQIKVLEIYVAYPIAIFVATVLACMITMRRVRKISVYEMNDME